MCTRKALGFLFVGLAIQWLAIGQSFGPLVTSHQGKYTFGVKRNSNEYARSGNAIIKQLSLQLTKSPEKTQYSIAYSYSLLSCSLGNGRWKLGFKLDLNKISGDTSTNGFDISNVLMPGIVSFDVRLIGNDGYVLDSASFANIKPGRDTLLKFPRLANTTALIQPEDIELSRIVFGYDKKGLNSITQLFKAIKTYEAATMLAEFAEKQADLLNRQAKNPSPEMLMQIDELSRVVRLLAQLQNKWDILAGSPDPNQLITRKKILAYRVHFIQQLFLTNAATRAARQSRSNIFKLSQDWVSMQVERLTDPNMPDFARIIYYQLGMVSYRPDDLAFLRRAASLILQTTRPDASLEGCYWTLNDAVAKAYLREGEKLSTSGRFSEAADLLRSAERMCEAIPYITCPDRLYQQKAVALYGTYHSYIRIARKALARDMPGLANDYTDAAEVFQHNNSRYIITDIEVRKLYWQVEEAWFRSGRAKLKYRGPKAAIADLRRAELASFSANIGLMTDSLSGERDKLSQELNIGKYESNKNMATMAEEDSLPFAKNAYINSQSQTIDDYPVPESEKVQAALYEIQRILDEVLNSLALRDCEGAFDMLDNVKQMMIGFGLPKEDPFVETADSYWYEADSCFCEKIQEDYKLLISEAERFAASKDFIEALNACTRAVELIEGNSLCNLNLKQVEILRNSLKWPATYQKMAMRVDSLVNSGCPGAALELYSETSKIFTQYKLQEQGLVLLPLVEFASAMDNLEFYAYSITYLLNVDRIEESLILLNRMEAENFTPEECRDSQELVAGKIAQRDSLETNPVQVHQRLLAYTGGSEWYSYFKLIYLKAIRL